MSKIEYPEDQENYLRETTKYFFGLEKPLKYGPVINTLDDLIAALYKEFETNWVNIEMVNHILLTYTSKPKEWKKFAKFDRYKYTRNLVDEGNGKFNLMILCWGEGHGSSIHDHSNSHCFMKMLKGELKETRYEFPVNAEAKSEDDDSDGSNVSGAETCTDQFDHNGLKEIDHRTISVNDVAYINDNIGLHRVENPSNTDTAVSLHLYCPPFNTCAVFQNNSGKKIISKMTFWSKYGVRQTVNV